MKQELLNELYQYAYSLTKDEQKAFDLVQETLLRLMDKKDQRIGEKFFLMKCIRNLFIDTIRKDSRLHLVGTSEDSDDDNFQNQWDSLTENQKAQSIRFDDLIIERQRLTSVLEKVSDEERELLFLKEVEGFTIDEMVTLLGIKRGTLLAKLFRLKKQLKVALENEGNSALDRRGK